ncbi:hypothetical protein OSB04_030705, partial [Centaurea solstitialis]
MGKAIRWLKALFGFKSQKNPNSGHRKIKNPACIRRHPTTSPADSPFHTPLYIHHHSDEQNKRAIEVAAATAAVAAANAAVAASNAAAAFVRLTSQRSKPTAGIKESAAAIKIQAFFARKALKALKSLVKFQAVVRGYLVRKALLRAKSCVYRPQSDKFQSRRSSIVSTQCACVCVCEIQQNSQFYRLNSKRVNKGRGRRISDSFQLPMDGRPNHEEVGHEEPISRLTRPNIGAWTPDSGIEAPHHLAIPNHQEFKSRFSTTQNTPRFSYSCGSNDLYEVVSKDGSFASHPEYMASTKSFRAKMRSHSAPKQRSHCGLGVKKRAEVECGPRMEKSKSPSLLEVNNFKNLVMSRIGKSSYVQW